MMKIIVVLIITLFSLVSQADDCIELLNQTRARVEPDKKWMTFKAGEVFKIIKKSADGQLVLAIQKDTKAVFKMTDVVEELCLHSVPLPSDALTIETADQSVKSTPVEKATASPLNPPPAPTVEIKQKAKDGIWNNFRFGIEYQIYHSASAISYNGLITKIPDPSDVSPLQDPLILDISKGTGSMIRLIGEFSFSKNIDLVAHIGQRKLTYKYLQKSNPSVTPVSLDSLQNSEKSFEVSNYGFGFGGRYYLSEGNVTDIRFFIGGEAEIQYATSSEITINALVGNLFKNTPTTVRAQVEQMTADGQLNMGFNWNRLHLSVGISPNMAYVLSLGGAFSF